MALAFHTRAHATHDRPEYVLVQGRASLSAPVPDYPSTVIDHWERFERWRDLGRLWRRWQRIYALRVEVRIAIERVVAWPDVACAGEPLVHGVPLPDAAAPVQAAPAKGTGPRINQFRAARRAGRLPDVLLGWLGSDGFPVVLPVRVEGADERGLLLHTEADNLPAGGRRAGLTAHWFSRGVVGQRQAIHTGWMQVPEPGRVAAYAPHTRRAYRMPASRVVYRIAAGAATRIGYRQARRAESAIVAS